MLVTALQPVMLTIARTNTTFHFTWNAVSNQVYRLQYTTNLLVNDWNNLGMPLLATSNSVSTTDTVGPDTRRYYRVSWTP
jgi:hypothetical protein